ncbi:MAG: glycogen/starch/alpha-glucan phosphorylase [Firmicutes bacterium]|nr:glycogen/starch/alpha-glucan phosphorylase [Bacillota bacterium]
MEAISKDQFRAALEDKLERMFGNTLKNASKSKLYKAIAMVIRDLIMEKWVYSREVYHANPERELYYLSMEFLMGRALGNNLINLEIDDVVKTTVEELGYELEEIREHESDAGLGNGGLGRLAACFLDSLSTEGLPAHGCGIRYEYGLFKQKIIDGYQVELPDSWLEDGHIWEVPVPEESEIVKFGGWVESRMVDGRMIFEHKGYQTVKAIPYDMPVLGFQSSLVNTLRLWAARSIKHLDMNLFGQGRYLDALEEKELAEVLSKVLYPEDNHLEGKALRLKQQYFFVSASIQSILHDFKRQGNNIRDFAKKRVIHINDTHPALAIPELMRILIDEEQMNWDEAWDITRRTFAYTNHTVMEEALEKWPADLFASLLPRIWDIVNEINERFTRSLWDIYPGDWDHIAKMAIIKDQQVHMANLCIVGSHSVNGVAQLHTQILKDQVFRNFYEIFPEKFIGITNGVTFRRFLLKANPKLADCITDLIGDDWILDSRHLEKLEEYKDDEKIQLKIKNIRHSNKEHLAEYIKASTGIIVNPESIYDVHIKRLHEYKRQLLNALHILYLYRRIITDPNFSMVPRTFIFAAKAAPGYRMAKLIIKLIHSIGEKVNNDPRVRDLIKVAFLENYRVSLAEKIICAADVSEQISTAGKEASGTGNMKLMLNGALTIGTQDGANIEIMEAIGKDSMFVFGLTSKEIEEKRQTGTYNPLDIYNTDKEIKEVLDSLVGGFLDSEHPEIFREIYTGLLLGYGAPGDPYFVLADFRDYIRAHEQIDELYRKPEIWWEKAIINIANSGVFSSDRTVFEYNDRVWHIPNVRQR